MLRNSPESRMFLYAAHDDFGGRDVPVQTDEPDQEVAPVPEAEPTETQKWLRMWNGFTNFSNGIFRNPIDQLSLRSHGGQEKTFDVQVEEVSDASGVQLALLFSNNHYQVVSRVHMLPIFDGDVFVEKRDDSTPTSSTHVVTQYVENKPGTKQNFRDVLNLAELQNYTLEYLPLRTVPIVHVTGLANFRDMSTQDQNILLKLWTNPLYQREYIVFGESYLNAPVGVDPVYKPKGMDHIYAGLIRTFGTLSGNRISHNSKLLTSIQDGFKHLEKPKK